MGCKRQSSILRYAHSLESVITALRLKQANAAFCMIAKQCKLVTIDILSSTLMMCACWASGVPQEKHPPAEPGGDCKRCAGHGAHPVYLPAA